MYARFGHWRLEQELPSPVDVILSKTHAGISDSMSTQIVLREEYETLYGIFNHEDAKHRPLALVAMQPKEDASRYSKLYRTIRRYAHHEIEKKFGLSLTEFLELPHDYVELLFQVSAEIAQQQQPDVDRAIKELEKSR